MPSQTSQPGDTNKIAQTGNASNPSPQPDDLESTDSSQLLSKEAEKYLREGGNIEDMPDAQDEQEMDETINKENKNS